MGVPEKYEHLLGRFSTPELLAMSGRIGKDAFFATTGQLLRRYTKDRGIDRGN